MELRAAHEHPRFPQEWIVFFPAQPLAVFLSLSPSRPPLGPALDAMQLDGLLRFLDGAVKVGLAELAAVLVTDGIERKRLGEVVMMPVLFLQRAVDISYRTVVIDVVPGGERMPPPARGSVLLRRATHQ